MEISHRYPAAPLRPINVPGRCSAYMSVNFNNYKASPSSTNTNLQYDVASSESESFKNRIFILGMGYVGKFFAQELLNKEWYQDSISLSLSATLSSLSLSLSLSVCVCVFVLESLQFVVGWSAFN